MLRTAFVEIIKTKTRTLDPLGGGHLVREVRESRHSGWVPYLIARRFDFPGGRRDAWPSAYSAYYGDGLPKRNFDEIDRSGLDTFVKKRNFDEIDQTSMPFPYSKRFLHMYGHNYVDVPESSFDKKRTRADYPMDEIDLSHFPIGSKRSFDGSR
ncbi:Orcokinin peptides [Eumeta japonica]|uniref:Orcokinin peptides n=1 Tax=Eumeta variegata TaxID=151549 RepID=A0A4C1U8B4_EUMVA|nr:Orcokinin peptides [Eumeta japonica]